MNDKDYLIKKINESGIPLEIYISKIFSKNELWYIEPNMVFLDYETSKERELDLKATLDSEDFLGKKIDKDIEFFGHSFNLIFLIECKKNPENSWVFFKGESSILDTILETVSFTGILEHYKGTIVDIFNLNESELRDISVCHHCIEIKGDTDKKKPRIDNIFEAKYQIKKALFYEKNNIEKDKKNYIKACGFDSIINRGKKDFHEMVDVLIPIIVFDGRLFEANQKDPYSITKDDLKEVDVVRYKTELIGETSKIIFVMKKEYFEKFIDKIYRLIKDIDKKIEKDSERIRNNLKEAYFARHDFC